MPSSKKKPSTERRWQRFMSTTICSVTAIFAAGDDCPERRNPSSLLAFVTPLCCGSVSAIHLSVVCCDEPRAVIVAVLSTAPPSHLGEYEGLATKMVGCNHPM